MWSTSASVSQTIWDTSAAYWLAVCITAAGPFPGRISSYLTMYWLFHFELLPFFIYIVVLFNILTVISCMSQVVDTWVCWPSSSSIRVLISFCCVKKCTYSKIRSLNITILLRTSMLSSGVDLCNYCLLTVFVRVCHGSGILELEKSIRVMQFNLICRTCATFICVVSASMGSVSFANCHFHYSN